MAVIPKRSEGSAAAFFPGCSILRVFLVGWERIRNPRGVSIGTALHAAAFVTHAPKKPHGL